MIKKFPIKKSIQIIFIVIALLLICVGAGLPIVNHVYNNQIHSNAVLKHTEITDNRLNGKLDLQYDAKDNYYWLYYQKENKSSLVWSDDDIKGYVTVKLSGNDKIDIVYDYFDDLLIPKNDKIITLDLSKGETYHTNFWKSFFE